MKLTIYLFLLLLAVQASGQTKRINFKLKNQLDSVFKIDQKYRELLYLARDYSKKDSISKTLAISINEVDSYIMNNMIKTDTLNLAFIESVITEYGYPGITLVGEGTNETAFYVIQHSSKIEKYLPIIRKAGQEKELPFKKVAMMEDRYLMHQGKEQIYGTQFCSGCLKNGDTSNVAWPIKDAENVNKRREQAGFENTVEQQANNLKVKYRVVKLEEVKR
jgi:hypothetical protein